MVVPYMSADGEKGRIMHQAQDRESKRHPSRFNSSFEERGENRVGEESKRGKNVLTKNTAGVTQERTTTGHRVEDGVDTKAESVTHWVSPAFNETPCSSETKRCT
jgi:hypothetical protein